MIISHAHSILAHLDQIRLPFTCMIMCGGKAWYRRYRPFATHVYLAKHRSQGITHLMGSYRHWKCLPALGKQ